jgi:HEAT repeat protein
MKSNWQYPCRVLLAGLMIYLTDAIGRGESYELSHVKGIEAFSGSQGAKDLLHKNGFVVADPGFKQIFEPYIKSPEVEEPSEKNRMGVSLPAFITTDSAWHTYHVLLEEGVKDMEQIQSQRLLNFSSQLLNTAKEQQAGSDLVLFASVGLALQAEKHRQELAPEEKRIVDGLRSGSSSVDVPIGFSLAPAVFRAQSFYTQSPELSDYFAARQWYASVVFRLNNARETKSAIALARLVNGNPELLTLWKQLSEPFDAFLAPAEDGTIREYGDAANAVLGTNFTSFSLPDAQIVEIQKRLEKQLTDPRVNDQFTTPAQYLDFGKETRGFRLLPPRQLPCAVCFQKTVEPKIPGRMYPSGLDFLAASPVLRSPAAVRAVQTQFGKSVADQISKTDCGPMPDSLHGEAMKLLATLQKPLPEKVPAPLRTDAWQDLQLWTQLGAWAEQRHTWALHSKLSVLVMGSISPPKGMVAPYPDFFAGMAQLARRTAAAFQRAGLDREFEPKAVGDELMNLVNIEEKILATKDFSEMEKRSGELEQLGEFRNQYYEKHQSELEKTGSRDAYNQIRKHVTELARRGSSGQANSADVEELRLFFNYRQNVARLISEFAPVCDRLANLAKKSLNNEPLTEDDAKWIENYGVTLAGFSFYYGNSYEVPRDDFPIVTRVFSNPVGDSMLYAGLARPQALYIILPVGKSLQLYRGAVLTYREFVRPNDKLLDDDSWRELVGKGQTPSAPPFTKSFYAETSVTELLQKLRAQSTRDNPNYGDTEEIIWQISGRATENDLAQILEFVTHTKADENGEAADALAEIIARLPWKAHERQIVDLLASPDYTLANAAAHILVEQPIALDINAFIAKFAEQPPRTRRLYCTIISALPRQTEASQQMLLRALHDHVDGVRWQAALAIGKSGWYDEQSRAALLSALDDTNEFVGVAAVHAFVKLHATNTCPMLLTKLKARIAQPAIVSEHRTPEALAIMGGVRGEEEAIGLLDEDNLALKIDTTVTEIMQKRATLRTPPLLIDVPTHNYNLADAIIEALGDLGYLPAADELFSLRGTNYDAEATRALGKLAPDRLADELLKVAQDKKVDGYLREKALIALGNSSATNRVRELIPLLDDTTVIEYSRPMPGAQMKVCDRAASTIGIFLGWEDNRMSRMFLRPEEQEKTLTRARQWAKEAP